MRCAKQGGGGALSRTELTDDRAWRQSVEHEQVFRVIGVDHAVYCLRPVRGVTDQVNGAVLWRAVGRPDFTAREKAVVGGVHAVIAPLVGGPLARFGEPSPADLPPRVRQVHVCLLQVDPDQQIVKRLGISPHTVNQYVKVVLRHYRCQSRMELLARWVRRGWGNGFAWASPPPAELGRGITTPGGSGSTARPPECTILSPTVPARPPRLPPALLGLSRIIPMRWLITLVLGVFVAPDLPAAPPSSEEVELFEAKVRPVLAEHCYSCHGEKKQSGGLRLDTPDGLKAGADNGPVVVAGDPAKSRLIGSVGRTGDYPMPPKKPLPAAAVAVLTEWVKAGAAFPQTPPAAVAKADPSKHWAFQTVRRPAVPSTQYTVHSEIDQFVYAKLEQQQLKPAPPADRRTLARRAYLDLLGLPPTFEQVEAFARDESPDAWPKLIDTLLASPHYGERWGRYWLDIARYADTKGYVFQEDRNFPYAYTYRVYVVRAFNEDKPFDRFVVEQLAADKLPAGDDNRHLAAMGFLTLGRRFLSNTHDIIDDRIDVVTRGLMGLTVTCARCHDHKYDPIPAKDYYSLYGVFASSAEPKELPRLGAAKSSPETERFERELAKQEGEYAAEVAKRFAAALAKLRSADGFADHLRAALDARALPANGVGDLARQRNLSRAVLEKWRAYVADQLKAGSPVLAPLAAVAQVPDADFPALAPGVWADPAQPAHPVVRQVLLQSRPRTFREAARTVAVLLTDPPKDASELAAVFASGGPTDFPLADAQKVFNRLDRDQLQAVRRTIDAFQAGDPAAPARAHVLTDGPKFDPYVFLRGNPDNHGPTVPRQFVSVAGGSDRKPFADGSGRLELAHAIASPDNPLTARVFVNRVWAGHFGQGLVRTPSDFGLRSDPPTHPELLDWLADGFVKDGWSTKRLHKRIMLSAAYQRSSVPPAGAADVENRLLARQNRRRLDFEALRDSLLSAAGKLDPAVGGRPVDLFNAPFSGRRTVYGRIDRTSLPGVLRAFDVASPDLHSPQRPQTTVPQQALFLLNSPFVLEMAKALAARAAGPAPDERVTALYRLALSRNPTPDELALGREFAAAGGPAAWDQLAQVLLLCNEFAFVD